MNNQNIIIGVIVVVAVAVIGWYMWSTPTMPTDETATTVEEDGTQTSNPTTLKTALAKGGNYTCTIETMSDSAKATGTVYGSGGKTRLDLKTETNSGATTVTIHIIRASGTAYTWVDGQTVGTKAAITTSSKVIPQPTGGVISISEDSSVASDCHAWLPVESQFMPPKEITFVAQ